MYKMSFSVGFVSDYSNKGQAIEQVARFVLTGKREKADNIAHDKGADCLHYQIKSARATVCRGLDIAEHLARDVALEYIYITQGLQGYIMNRAEWLAFCVAFGTVTRESPKNGGGEKIKLKSESRALIQWLEERARE